jgi:hypothetical protein
LHHDVPVTGNRSIVRRAAGRARRRIDELLAEQGERSARRLAPGFPYAIRLDHAATAELRPRYGSGRPPHRGLEALVDAAAGRTREVLDGFTAYADELARIPIDVASSEPCWMNLWLPGLDTVALYGFVRDTRPARYVEIGSGQSTKVVARARRDGDLPTRIVSIDPSPRADVDGLCDEIVRSPLETVDLDAAFGDVAAGDIVFFDGSHRVLPNSDCVAFFFDVLPSLPPGVLVGIHDIYLPDDYPEGFLELWWSEQYLLAAWLLGGSAGVDIVLPAFYASGRDDLAAAIAPVFDRPELVDVPRHGSAFWLETR